ncbi:MAG TPA: class I SAM-dependent RNA methyltransferase [Micavibrio sp.]
MSDIELTIENLGARGDGVGRTAAGARVFVERVLPGEVVSARMLDQERAVLHNVVVASPDRVVPPCPHFEQCGGCVLQHAGPALYHDFKKGVVLQNLARVGITPAAVVGPLVSAPGTRRRATFAAVKAGKGVVLGFNQRGSLKLVEIKSCAVLHPRIVALLPALRVLMAKVMKVDKQKADITVSEAHGELDVLITSPLTKDVWMPFPMLEAFQAFAEEQDIARLSWRKGIRDAMEPIYERKPFRVSLAGVDVIPPPGSFLQATTDGEQALIAAVLEGVSGLKGKVADLYAGSGTFTFPLLRAGFDVLAVEGYKGALQALQTAGRSFSNLKCEVRDLAREPLSQKELNGLTAVVIDPPREGAAAQMKVLADSAVSRIISVSCSAPSFARDAAFLIEGGYRLEKLIIVDQFLWSHHVEMVGIFVR